MCLQLFVVIAAWSWAGLTLAAFGLFSPWLVTTSAAGLVIVSFAWLRREGALWHAATNARGRDHLWLLLWIVLAVALFVPPGEYAIDGADGSIYLSTGVALAGHGSLHFPEPLLDLTALADRPAVFKPVRGFTPMLDLFPGGMQIPQDGGDVRPGFFHLYPVWIATATWIAGPGGGYHVSWIFAVLGVGATWSAARQLSTVSAANIAAGLLCLNFAEVWFARSASSETVTQFFVMSGLALTAAAVRSGSRGTGACAGVAFGLAACTRIDALILVCPIVALTLGAVWLRGRWSGAWSGMTASFAVLAAQAVVVAFVVSGPYTQRVFRLMLAGRDVSYVALALPVIVFAAFAGLWLARGSRAGRTSLAQRLALGGLVLLVVVRLGPAFTVGHLALLVTPLVTALAAVGMVMMLRRPAGEEGLLALGIFLASALFYGESVRDRNEMPQLLRRYVPVVLPLVMLFAAHALVTLGAALGRWHRVMLVIPSALAVWSFNVIRPILDADPMRGAHSQISSMAASLPQGAVLLTDASTPSHLGLSLRYLFDRGVIFVQPREDAARVIAGWAARLREQGRPLLVAVGRDGDGGAVHTLDAATLSWLDLAPAGTFGFDLQQLTPSIHRLPDTVRRFEPTVELYRAAPASAMTVPHQLEIGDHDIGVRVHGFHGRETIHGAAARWTDGRAVVLLPQLLGAATRIVIRVASPRPPGIPSPAVSMSVDDELVGVSTPVDHDFREITIPLPAVIADRLTRTRCRLTLTTQVFTPAATGQQDGRTLGVVVDWIRLEGS